MARPRKNEVVVPPRANPPRAGPNIGDVIVDEILKLAMARDDVPDDFKARMKEIAGLVSRDRDETQSSADEEDA